MGIFDIFYSNLFGFFAKFPSFVYYVMDCISSNPILLLTFGLFILGGSIGIFGRILSRD